MPIAGSLQKQQSVLSLLEAVVRNSRVCYAYCGQSSETAGCVMPIEGSLQKQQGVLCQLRTLFISCLGGSRLFGLSLLRLNYEIVNLTCIR
jgi:hypothetical protein